MKEVKIKVGDDVKLFNGTYGTITDIDYTMYQVEISGEHMYPTRSHILNIKYVNNVDCELNCAIIL